MSFLVSESFWWHVALIAGGILLFASGGDVIGIPVGKIAGFAFEFSGVLGVIGDFGGPVAPRRTPTA